jgi:NAD(P)-dependent dehydrogenase (short-subunit alcohol dehydrogenase family)
MYDRDGQQVDLRPFNSWVMKDDEVSIVEMLEVHVINAIAPFAINSRLKRLMRNFPEAGKYIVNVSSKEGQFNSDKPWRHPHTNMAKASLNMMTRTCASEYAKHKIFMNAVDPGWISFQHPYPQVLAMQQRGVQPPFDAVDAAARICDPIYLGVNEGRYFYGKLFKDYVESQW